MTVPADIALAIVFGASIALASRVQLHLTPRPWYATRYFALTVGFQLMLVAPSAAYRYLFHPDWAFMYLFDAGTLWGVWSPAALLVVMVAGLVAFALGAAAARARRVWVPIVLLIIALGGLMAVAAVGANRLGVVGTYAQWQGDYGLRPLLETDLAVAMAVMGGAVLIGWVVILYRFAREGAAMSHVSG